MSESISKRIAGMSAVNDAGELRKLLETALVDMAALRVTVAALVVDVAAGVANHNTLIAKLNADAGITDTDYAVATAQTSEAPDALTLEA